MKTPLCLLLAASSLLLASCSGGTTTTTNGTSSSSSGGTGGGSGITAGLDGTWDITSAGDGNIGPSEATISNGVITGAITSPDEGQTSGGCKNIKDRGDFNFTVSGNALSGTIDVVREWEGSDCPTKKKESVPVTGSRSSATAGTGLTGEWELTVGEEPTMVVSVDGLTMKVWDKAAKAAGKEPGATVTVAGNNLAVTAKRDDYSLAARRR